MINSKSNLPAKHCEGKKNPNAGNKKEITKAAGVGLSTWGQAGSRGDPCTTLAAHEKARDTIKIANISY